MAEEVSGWKPLGTAPKDGSYVLISSKADDVPWVAFWNGHSWDDGDFNDHIDGCTHWHPLPEPPK
jgi:REP element-mobilizing transposase RayT